MKDNGATGQSDEGWFCEHIRVTTFTQPFDIADAGSWWKDVTGEPPSKSTVEPKAGRRADEGTYRDRTLSLKIQSARVDWILGVDPVNATSAGGFPSIGSLPDSLSVMREIIEKWVKLTLPPVVRMAVGTAVMLPMPDRPAGYRALQSLLPNLKLDPENSREFEYQINRPRKSAVIPVLEINRLCRWTVAAFMVQTIVIGQTPIAPTVQSVACRIEPDVNTDGLRIDPIPTATLFALYNELVDLAKELVEKGDVA